MLHNHPRPYNAFLRAKLGKRHGVFGVLALATICVLVALNLPRKKKMVDISDLDPTTKRILLWNDFFHLKHYGVPLGRSAFSGCKVNNCELWDRQYMEVELPHDQFDAVLFHGVDTSRSHWWWYPDLPLVRRSHQRYIFFLLESPLMYPNYYNLKNFFNWTATYRRDSDLYMPYLYVRSTQMIRDPGNISGAWREPTFENMTNISETIANKTKLVAWFVSHSNIPSRREVYVAELSKYIQVDIFGKGKRLSCSNEDKRCDQLLDTTYKFYLSFENSLCADYVTEKFLRALRHNVVPVVYGGADYKVYAPPLSYINVQDFESPRALAGYLHYLDQHPEEYQKYFWWKEYYNYYHISWWCRFCEKLHGPEELKKVQPDIESWWNYPGVCTSPKDFFNQG